MMNEHWFDKHIDRIRNARRYSHATDEVVAGAFEDVNDDLDHERAFLLLAGARALDALEEHSK